MAQRFSVRSSLALDAGTGMSVSTRWMQLLAAVAKTRSISAAAKQVGLSYKAAWDAVDSMNNLADKPLVLRSKGGKGGGGTQLTARGQKLVDTFKAVESENQRFVQALNRQIDNARDDLQILGRLNMRTSARNHFSGKVVRVRKGTVNDEVEIALPGGESLIATVTSESTKNLGLKRGKPVIALVKASWVMVGISDDAPLQLSARNQLEGTIQRLTPGAVNTEIVIALKGGNSVAAIITNIAADELRLKKGQQAVAIFKASSVILGVSE